MFERLRRLRRDSRLTIAKRDLSSLSREKTIVLALLIQLFVAAFSSFLVVGLTSLYDPSSVEGGELDVGVSGEAREDLLAAARQSESIELEHFDTRTDAMGAFDDGSVMAVVEATYRSGETPGRIIQVDAVAPAGNFRTTLVVVQLRELLTALERNERLDRRASLSFDPLALPDDVEGSPYFGFTYTILLPLLLFLPPFISGSVAVDVFTEEIERGTLELLRAAPVSLLDVVEGKALAMILLAPLQAGLWILLLAVNGIAVGNPLALLTLVTAMATVLTVLGLGLGLLTGVRRQAQLAYSMLALLLFGAAIALPEHPATTVAKLAVDSATAVTFAHVLAFVAVAVAAVVALRSSAGLVDAERF